MTDSSATPQPLNIAWLRWRLFVNALRTTRGQLEFISRIFVGFLFSVIALGGAFGLALLCYVSLTAGKPQLLPVFFWMIFAFWQVCT